MAQATDQEIPAELQDLYEGTLQGLTWKDKPFIIKERHPFRIPELQGCRTIRPPIPRGSQVSDAMCNWRYVFGDAIKCWQKQPATDGAEPDGYGPYARDWWFTEAIGKLPWYFNWFMKQTLDGFFAGLPPLWCRTLPSEDVQDHAGAPDSNYCGWHSVTVERFEGADQHYIYFKRPTEDVSVLWAYVVAENHYGDPYTQYIAVHEITEEWEECVITRNNAPPLGRVIGFVAVHPGKNYWLRIPADKVYSIALRKVPPDGLVAFHSYNIGGATRIPFWTK